MHPTRRGAAGHPHGAPGHDLSTFLASSAGDPLTSAFSRRTFAGHGLAGGPVEADDVQPALRRIYDTPRTAPAAAYVHVPYCQNHCLFCGFFQNVWRPQASSDYVDDLAEEIARLADTPLVASAPVEAVYLGGGTPSALAAPDLARLIASLRRRLPMSDDCEITVEGRAFDFGVEKAIAALDAGANRISLGVQTFDTAIRKRLGRKLAGDEVAAFLSELVALGRASVVADLIYGLPGQDEAIWRRDIETAIDIGLDGVSLYALNIWKGGPLDLAIGAGKLPAAGDLAAQATAYASACTWLTSRGWRQLAQSHLVRSERERNRYNRMIKAGTFCLPFGPGAGGNAHGHRWRNVVDIGRRRALIAEQRFPVEALSRLTPRHRSEAAITAGLEAGTLDLRAIDETGFAAAARPLLDNWVCAGLGELEQDRFRTTRAGAFWLTNLTGGLHAVLAGLPQNPQMPANGATT